MDVVFLGTASAQPSPTRNHSSLAFRFDGETWLFDCGEGTQHQLIKAPSIWSSANISTTNNVIPKPSSEVSSQNLPPPPRLAKITRIFVTHLHGDHCFGLPGLMCTLSQTVQRQDTMNAEDDKPIPERPPFEVYGPKGMRSYLRNALKGTMSRLGSRYVVHELHFEAEVVKDENEDAESCLHPDEILGNNLPLIPLNSDQQQQQPEQSTETQKDGTEHFHAPPPKGHWLAFQSPRFKVYASPIAHTVPTVGYLIQESPTQGRLKVELAGPILNRNKAALGMKNPMSLLSKLKAGETLTMPDGTVLNPEEMVEPEKRGRRVVILGDTSDPSGMEAIPELWGPDGSKGCDMLIHEATNACTIEDISLNAVRNPDARVESESALRQQVRESAISHGHSTPEMAGEVGKRWNAKLLVLNHFSSRYGGDEKEENLAIMEEIRVAAVGSFGGGDVITARDFMVVNVPKAV
ncbi:hypothetical protein HDU97_002774 [Phlyctochytrium planicorne]|nr:hypothetical protein HDU97_002774 [Phlyctochytrium planicorne]